MKSNTILKKYFKKLDTHTLEVYKKSYYSIIVKVFGMLAGLVVSIVLGRTIGSEGLGIISLVERLIGVVLVLAMLGMNNVILKEISIAYENKAWNKVSSVLYTAFRINLPFALLLSILLILMSDCFANHIFQEPRLKIPLIICASMIGVQVYSRIIAAGVNGFRKIWQSNLVNNTLSIVIVALGLLCFWLFQIDISILNVVLLYAIARLIVALAIGIYWRKLYDYKGERRMQTKAMLKVALPLLIVVSAGMVAANADTIMLGWLSNTNEVGIYSVASRLALLTSFFHFISASVLAPKIAALYSQGKIVNVKIMVNKVTGILFVIGVINLFVFIIFGHSILGLWGSHFIFGYWALIFLCIGQLFNLGTGATGVVLMMTGHEKVLGYVSLSSAMLNLILNFFLIRFYGAIGAAIATAITIVIDNLIKLYLVNRYTGIFILPNFSKKN